MVLKAILMLLLPYCAFGGANEGYLYQNLTSTPSPVCTSPPKDDQVCRIKNSTLDLTDGKYAKIVEETADLITKRLSSLDVMNITANSSCQESIKDYFCAGVQICHGIDHKLYGVDFERQQRGCINNKKQCSQAVRAAVGAEHWPCDATYTLKPVKMCTQLPGTDACPKRHYKVLKNTGDLYSNKTRDLVPTLARYIKQYVGMTCFEKYISMYCYMLGGPVCSDDEKLIVHVISREDCNRVLETCRPSGDYPDWDKTLSDAIKCDTLPSNTTARVLLPAGVNATIVLGPDVNGDETSDATKNKINLAMVLILACCSVLIKAS